MLEKFPTHAYVPGENARHPEGAFDPIRGTAQPGMSEAALANSDAFQMGLRYLKRGFYWEAHEVLEPVWMACPPNAVSRSVVQGLIQLANARLKVKMGKPKAAARLFDIARKHLAAADNATVLGITASAFLKEIDIEIVQYNT